MRSLRRDWRWWASGAGLLLACVAAGIVLLGGGGGEEEPAQVAETEREAAPPGDAEPEETEPGPEADEGGEEDVQGPPPIDEDSLNAAELKAARTVRAYVQGLDARDGKAVCDLLAPGALDPVELPRRRGGCAESLSASIGHRDPRGLPVWESARVHGLLTVSLDGDRASVTATTVTTFADRDQPSVEDDVVHLRREGGRWLIAKASATLYRAVGIEDIPPRVLVAPD